MAVSKVPLTCRHCRVAFEIETYLVRRGQGTYCSKACFHAAITRPPMKRLLAKVRKTATCWLWLGATTKKGYGVIGVSPRINGKVRMTGAHRMSWELHRGPIPEGLCVLHKCDNPPCVNPDHLFLGTKKDNLHDAMRKGRWTAQVRAKLTHDQVREIRRLYVPYKVTAKTLAARFGVSMGCVYGVLLGTNWSHIK